jgi:hypothetical protein
LKRKRWLSILGLGIVVLLLVEGGLRLTVFRQTVLEIRLRNRMPDPVSLPPPNQNSTTNANGLYEGGGKALFRTSANRFIEPEPQGDYHYRVLFLGDSTTRAVAVAEDKRWVALLNEPGVIGAYNGATPGSNTVEKYATFRYLTEKGFKFDLVVLMTSRADIVWQHRLAQVNQTLRADTYTDAVRAYYTWLTRPDLWSTVVDEIRVIRLADRGIRRLKSALNLSQSLAANVSQTAQVVGLDQCALYPDNLSEYGTSTRINLKLMADAVTATHTKLLIVSQPHAFLTPSGSFMNDLRRASVVCSANTVLSIEGEGLLLDKINTIYLESGTAAGAETFDLAQALYGTMNGPNGGVYNYDGIHYTPAGSVLIANTLRPVLHGLLMGADF